MRKMLLLLLSTLVALGYVSPGYALGALGGSAFPLTFITSNPINGTDEFNELLYIMNQQCAAATNAPTLTVQDAVFTIQDDGDAAKQLVFSLGGMTTATKLTLANSITANRTITFPDATDTLAVLGTAQTFTATQNFNSAGTVTVQTALNISAGATMTGTGTVTLASAGAITENGTLGFGSNALINTQGIPFSTTINANPLQLNIFKSFTAANVSAGINIINSAASRTIFPGNGTIMVSGSASGATNVIIECTPSAATITSIPISGLIDGRPINFTWTSSAATAGATAAKALAAGCSSADAVMISAPALATTTQVFINLPYTVQ